jgi:hypothetical protein
MFNKKTIVLFDTLFGPEKDDKAKETSDPDVLGDTDTQSEKVFGCTIL